MNKWGGGASVAIQRPAPRVRGAFEDLRQWASDEGPVMVK